MLVLNNKSMTYESQHPNLTGATLLFQAHLIVNEILFFFCNFHRFVSLPEIFLTALEATRIRIFLTNQRSFWFGGSGLFTFSYIFLLQWTALKE